MKPVLVFDLDNTLYDEITYVWSGFRAVSRYLQETYGVPFEDSYQFMQERLGAGRGKIFDDLLLRYNLYRKKNVSACLGVYRRHHPEIRVDRDGDDCLNRFKEYPLYIVTDGNRMVQWNKLKALGLVERVRHCYATHCYGRQYAKPSPYCFLKICEREKRPPEEIFYLGDNPEKDFVGLKPLGFKTIRVLKGEHRTLRKPDLYEADYEIHSLTELTPELLHRLMTKSPVFL